MQAIQKFKADDGADSNDTEIYVEWYNDYNIAATTVVIRQREFDGNAVCQAEVESIFVTPRRVDTLFG